MDLPVRYSRSERFTSQTARSSKVSLKELTSEALNCLLFLSSAHLTRLKSPISAKDLRQKTSGTEVLKEGGGVGVI